MTRKKSNDVFTYTDRYQAMGIPHPDPATCCNGRCEGTGMIPVSNPFKDITIANYKLTELWLEAHKKCSTIGRIKQFLRFDLALKYGWNAHFDVVFNGCDGWHFVKCPTCRGTGKKVGGTK